METELLIAMLLVAAGAASLGALLASRTWPVLHGHEHLAPISTAGSFQGRSVWVCEDNEQARVLVGERIRSISEHARVLYLPNPAWGASVEADGVRRMRTARPRVQEVVDAGKALSVYGQVVLVVGGSEALEATAPDESPMAAMEELFEICSFPIAVVLTQGTSLPAGDWSVEELHG
ncbi:MAG: hypothetical protein VX519_04395 [Myxococcota bacterium]|nr:hypothetical protein [Myxococcota bacterium]